MGADCDRAVHGANRVGARAREVRTRRAAARDENNIAASIERANARSREATRDEMTMTMKMTMLDWRA